MFIRKFTSHYKSAQSQLLDFQKRHKEIKILKVEFTENEITITYE